MTIRQVAVQGGLALGALVLAYATWQRGPELAADEVFVVDIGRNDLVSVRFEDQEKSTWVELGHASDKSGPFISVRLGPQEPSSKAPDDIAKVDAKAGAKIFADNCTICHGDAGKGNQDVGSPNLTDKIWLYGSDEATIIETVTNGRAGVMPAWVGRLDPSTIKAMAVYVHSLGGGK